MTTERGKLWRIPAVLAIAVVTASSGNLFAQFPGGGLPGGEEGGLPGPCGVECFATAIEAAAACREAGGNFFECAEVFAAELTACREAAGCEGGERPPVCGEECLIAARDAATACRDAGGDSAACLAEVRTQLRACLEAAGCELPDPPDGPARCGVGCLSESLGAVRDCLQGGGGLRECVGAFRATFEACREAAGCGGGDEPPDEEGDAEVLALLVGEPFVRGDANSDGAVDISDPIAVLGHLFLGQPAPACMDAADANDDGVVDISDPAMALSALFQGGAPLSQPYPEAGFDATDDAFNCDAAS